VVIYFLFKRSWRFIVNVKIHCNSMELLFVLGYYKRVRFFEECPTGQVGSGPRVIFGSFSFRLGPRKDFVQRLNQNVLSGFNPISRPTKTSPTHFQSEN